MSTINYPIIPLTVADTFRYSCIGICEIIRHKSPIRPKIALDVSQLLERISRDNSLWSIITDEFLSKFGIDSITTILHKHPQEKIIILTAVENVHHLQHLESLGVKALVHKSTLGYEIREVILNKDSHELQLCPRISKIYHSHVRNPSSHQKILSERQAEIIVLLIRGSARKVISDSLGINVYSVHTQCARIYEKQRRYEFKSLLDMARADGIII